MSITKSQRARLGVFMIIGGVLLVFFIAIPVGFKISDRTKVYHSFFEGESVSGLDVGAIVKYHGVNIGKVEDIGYDREDLTKIRVDFRIDGGFPMKEDMYVQTGLLGITGLLYVEIMGGSNEAKELEAGSEITSKPSLMSAITGKAEVIISKVELLLNHLNVLTNPDSLASIKRILENVEGITATARGFMDEFRPDVKSIASSTKRTMGKVDTITSNIQSITGKIDRDVDLGQFGSILDRIDSTAHAMKELSMNLDMTVKQSREDITVSMENLRETLENANELSKILMENPSLILRGESQKERRVK